MSIEGKTIGEKISELEGNLKTLEDDKAKISIKIKDLDKAKRKDRHIADHLQKKSNEIDKSIEDIQKELRKLMSIKRNKKDREVDEIIGSLSNKRGKDTEKRKIKDEEVDEILNFLSGKKEKPRTEDSKITNDDVDEIINYLSDKKEKPSNEKRKIKNNEVDEILDSLSDKKQEYKGKQAVRKSKRRTSIHKPKHIKLTRYKAKGKEMIEKVKALMSNAKKNIDKAMLDAKKNIDKAMSNVKKNADKARITLRDKAKYMEKKSNRAKEVAQDKMKSVFLSRESKKYTGRKGTKRKIETLAAILIGVAMTTGTISIARNSNKFRNDSIYEGAIKVTSEYLEEMENSAKLREENSKASDKSSNSKPVENNSNTKLDVNNNSKPTQNNNSTKPNQSNSNKQEINNNNKKPSQNTTNNAKPENNKNEIKKIYGGEISASENGIRTEEDILYAVKQIGWRKEIVDNIKEMMPGLLKMQTDFDLDPLCALAVFQWESNCGTAYEPGGDSYERENDFRLANSKVNDGVGLSNDGYAYYDSWATAAHRFGHYVRNADPYILSPALKMADLKSHNGYTWIFGGAGEEGQNTYKQLKACLEKRVTIADVSKAVEACTASEIKEMTSTITSSINKQKSASKAMAGR